MSYEAWEGHSKRAGGKVWMDETNRQVFALVLERVASVFQIYL